MKTITSKRCREICQNWHGGQWSALYQFASSGVYLVANHLKYLRELQECREPEYYLHPGTISKKNDAELKSAIRYFENIGTIKTEWVKHEIYGYLMPVCENSEVEPVLYFV